MFHLQMVYILIVHSHFSFFVPSGYLSCITHNHCLTLKTVVCHFLCSSLGFSIRFNFFNHNTSFLYQKGMEAWPFLWSWVPFVHSNGFQKAFFWLKPCSNWFNSCIWSSYYGPVWLFQNNFHINSQNKTIYLKFHQIFMCQIIVLIEGDFY